LLFINYMQLFKCFVFGFKNDSHQRNRKQQIKIALTKIFVPILTEFYTYQKTIHQHCLFTCFKVLCNNIFVLTIFLVNVNDQIF